jgi:hypothetical protein
MNNMSCHPPETFRKEGRRQQYREFPAKVDVGAFVAAALS